MPEPTSRSPEQRLEEIELIGRVAAGEEAALEELYHRYSGPLYALAVQVALTDRFAQEVVQDVFLTLWRQAGRYDPERGAVSSWLFALTRNKAIDLLRRENVPTRRTGEIDPELAASGEEVDEVAWQGIRREHVLHALTQLPEAQRTTVELAFLGGLTHVEIAERLSIPLGTTKTRIRSGLLRMRSILGESLSEAYEAADTG